MNTFISYLFVFLFMSTSCFGGTIHALFCAADPIDFTISLDSPDGEQFSMESFIKDLSSNTGKQLQLTKLAGKKLNAKNIYQWLHTIRSSKEDIIFVFYEGPGMREKGNYSPWPSLNLEKSKESFPTTTIIEHISSMPHQLIFCMFDCDNNFSKKFPYAQMELKENKLHKHLHKLPKEVFSGGAKSGRFPLDLFEAKGTILLTSSQPGKPSSYGLRESFLCYLYYQYLLGPHKWKHVLSEIADLCDHEVFSEYNAGHHQRPFYYAAIDK